MARFFVMTDRSLACAIVLSAYRLAAPTDRYEGISTFFRGSGRDIAGFIRDTEVFDGTRGGVLGGCGRVPQSDNTVTKQ